MLTLIWRTRSNTFLTLGSANNPPPLWLIGFRLARLVAGFFIGFLPYFTGDWRVFYEPPHLYPHSVSGRHVTLPLVRFYSGLSWDPKRRAMSS